MSRNSMTFAACLVASFLSGCAAPMGEAPNGPATTTATTASARSQSRAMPNELPKTDLKAQTQVTFESIQLIQKLYPLYRLAITTPGYNCQLDKDYICHVRVDVFQATDSSSGLRYCIGIAPEYIIIKGKAKAKRIQWELQLLSGFNGNPVPWKDVSPQGSTLGFLGDEEHGLLILKNIYENGDHQKPQLKEGKRIKWNGVDDTAYVIKNDHRENGTATYLPIIVHTVGDQPALCGAPDPAIYNVD